VAAGAAEEASGSGSALACIVGVATGDAPECGAFSIDTIFPASTPAAVAKPTLPTAVADAVDRGAPAALMLTDWAS